MVLLAATIEVNTPYGAWSPGDGEAQEVPQWVAEDLLRIPDAIFYTVDPTVAEEFKQREADAAEAAKPKKSPLTDDGAGSDIKDALAVASTTKRRPRTPKG